MRVAGVGKNPQWQPSPLDAGDHREHLRPQREDGASRTEECLGIHRGARFADKIRMQVAPGKFARLNPPGPVGIGEEPFDVGLGQPRERCHVSPGDGVVKVDHHATEIEVDKGGTAKLSHRMHTGRTRETGFLALSVTR